MLIEQQASRQVVAILSGFAVLLDLFEALLGFPTDVPNPLGRSLG
jgi:hypothetical protein